MDGCRRDAGPTHNQITIIKSVGRGKTHKRCCHVI
jgi:hypothetical protein